MSIRIVPVAAEHREAWGRLYAGYAEFYRVDQSEAMREKTWSWLMDPAHEVDGFVALDGQGTPVGLAHYRPFARPLSATTGGFLDDLFVDPAARGSGAAEALIEAVAAEGRARLVGHPLDHRGRQRPRPHGLRPAGAENRLGDL